MFEEYERKFEFRELFLNNNNKTSGSGFIGVILGLIAAIGFLAGTFGFFFNYERSMDYLEIVLKLVAASTILMGVRKLGSQIFKKEDPEPKPKGETAPENLG